MFKFLRKYNKWILAVGGTLLMIVFLMPYALTQWVQQIGAQGANRGTVGDEESISAAEWDQVRREFAILSRMPGGTMLPWGEEITEDSYWYLLTREAEQAGLVAETELTGEELSLIRSNLNMGESAEVLESTLSKLEGVSAMFALYQSSGKLSDRRLREIARRRFHVANSEMIVLQADAEQAEDFEPTEEQILEQMQKYADDLPNEGEHGFGYRLPDRVKIEWLAVDGESIRESIRNDEEQFNSIAQRRYWRTHENQGGIPPVDSSGPIPQAVTDALLNELTEQRAASIAGALADILSSSERVLEEKNAAGLYVLPDDWAEQRLSLQDAAEELRERYSGIEIEYHARGDAWVPVAELGTLEQIGGATTDKFGNPRNLQQLIADMSEFDPQSALPLQVGIALPVMTGPGNSRFLPRVIAAEKSRPPTSPDEVRDDVVRDLRRLEHYHRLIAQAAELEQRAEQEGLIPLSLDLDTTVSRRTPVSLTNPMLLQFQLSQDQMPLAGPTSLPVIGLARDAIEKIVDHTLTLPQDVPVSDLPAEDRVFTVTEDESLAVLVVRLIDQQPLTEPLFRQLTQQGNLQGLVARDELRTGESLSEAFSYETLAARHNLKLDTRSDEDATEESPDESALASSASE